MIFYPFHTKSIYQMLLGDRLELLCLQVDKLLQPVIVTVVRFSSGRNSIKELVNELLVNPKITLF